MLTQYKHAPCLYPVHTATKRPCMVRRFLHTPHLLQTGLMQCMYLAPRPAPRNNASSAAGLLQLMTDEAELAAVLAHEAGHVLARHTAERIVKMWFQETMRLTL